MSPQIVTLLLTSLMRAVERHPITLMQQQSPVRSPQDEKLMLYQDAQISTGKVDCEAGILDQGVQPNFLRSPWTYSRFLKLVGLLSVALLLQHFWSTIPSYSRVPEQGVLVESVLQPEQRIFPTYHRVPEWGTHDVVEDDRCPQYPPLSSPDYQALLATLDKEFGTSTFKSKAYESLGAAVRIQSVSSDNFTTSASNDASWKDEFIQYFDTRFPNIKKTLKRHETDSKSMVYEWTGTENMKTVKPVMISVHVDVVPVDPETLNEWKEDPWSGKFDGTWIWGRGSCDDKARVISSFTAIETLLEHNFVPSRTVVIAIGIDEEIGGVHGATQIAEYLQTTYGPNSMALIVDEGGEFLDRSGTVFAKTSVAEKGYLDIKTEVITPGGHSSLPPAYTGIGILADLITNLENNPPQPELYRERTYYQGLQCRSRYDKGLPKDVKDLVDQAETSDAALRDLERRLLTFDPQYYALSGTTQAVDLIDGGVKVNALPEAASTTVNHRLADYSTLEALQQRFTVLASFIANKHNMTLVAFGRTVLDGPANRLVNLTVPPTKSLAPSPVTPTVGNDAWILFAGTIRGTFETQLRTDSLPKNSVAVPGMETANSDSFHYWNFTKNIFRYGHRGVADAYNGIHDVNEAMRAEGFLEQIRFFTRLILNADKTTLLHD